MVVVVVGSLTVVVGSLTAVVAVWVEGAAVASRMRRRERWGLGTAAAAVVGPAAVG